MELSHVQVVEFFHVAFLEVLSKRLDPARYVFKGGANLRYFFDSQRYSEDIDIDLLGRQSWPLEKKVDDVLESGALKALLRFGGLAVAEFSTPKQTETARRWKVALEVSGHSEQIRTKIEFSNRNGGDRRYSLDPVPSSHRRSLCAASTPAFSTTPRMLPPSRRSRPSRTARRRRRETSSISICCSAAARFPPELSTPSFLLTRRIALCICPLPLFAIRSFPFSSADVVELYDSEASWEQMQTFVAEKLEEAR